MRLVLSPPPAIVALLEDEYARALGEGELVGLLRLVVVLDDGGAQRVRRLHAPPARLAAAAHRRTVRRQRLRARPLLHLLLNTVIHEHYVKYSAGIRKLDGSGSKRITENMLNVVLVRAISR